MATDGKHEVRFIRALLDRNAGALDHVIQSARQEARNPSTTAKTSPLPGTGRLKPTYFDLDGFAAVTTAEELKRHFPKSAQLEIGSEVPGSARGLCSRAGLRCLGSASGLQIYVPETHYQGVFSQLVSGTRRVILPSRHINYSAITNRSGVYMIDVAEAMLGAGVQRVVLKGYGIKARLLQHGRYLFLPPHLRWIERIAAGSNRGKYLSPRK